MLRIVTCPFCTWSASFDPADTDRAEKINADYLAHLNTH